MSCLNQFNKTDAMVSVVIPCWGRKYRLLLPNALKSVYQQSYKTIETNIVSFPMNVAWAMNRGAFETTGDYLVFLGADDQLSPGYIEKCVNAIDSDAVGFVWTGCIYTGDLSGVSMPKKFMATRWGWVLGQSFGGQLGAMMINRECFNDLGGFDADSGFEDWDFCIRALKRGWKCKAIYEPLHIYNVSKKDKWASDKKLLKKYPVMRGPRIIFNFYRFIKRRYFDIINLVRKKCR